MGTLYDLLGALPSDDAEELRKAFRKAAKATHPDINPDNPDAALRFRELVRAYDILTDTEQRSTYDQLLAIALQPPAPQQSAPMRPSERSPPIRWRQRSFLRCWSAATPCSDCFQNRRAPPKC
ncbi:J domain-containing protein [Bradyrhizobium sp. RDI18]|uniref:J domain-containing protein n=1 Tax=Bradyrhizobium sp. RDI18 TaxID=3367400 RepID=UPI003721BE9E